MVDATGLEAIFSRIEAGKRLSKHDLQTLVAAVRLQQVTIATGDRAVAISGNADGAVIVTGNRNLIITRADAEAIRELMEKRPRAEELLLEAVTHEVDARLKQSLPNMTSIRLGMEVQPEQVSRPWDSDVKIGNKPAEPIPSDWDISRVFDETQGKLLILGNPGAGKTTMMLELAQCLCTCAKKPDFPIPVLFNLSNWKDDRQSIRDWLVAELNEKYGARKDIGESWISN
jgi:predicted NACHT family NTPase